MYMQLEETSKLQKGPVHVYLEQKAEDLESHKGKKLSGLSEKDLQEAPCFQHAVIDIPTSLCSICLDSFAYKDLCRTFPDCSHVFHKHCIDLWLVRRPTCPTCRTPFLGRSS